MPSILNLSLLLTLFVLVLGVVIFVPKNADHHQAQDKWNGVEQFRLLILLLLGSFLADIRYIHVLPLDSLANKTCSY